MDTLLQLLGWTGVALLIAGGLVGTLLPVLPGPPLVFFGLWLAALLDDYRHVGTPTLILLGVLVLLTVAIDFVASALGAQRVGASKQALSGALIGSFAGMFFGIPGLLIGPFAGAVIGELMARSHVTQAARVGFATWFGMLIGTLAKLALSLAMIGIFLISYWL
ncbi:hypothetical protein SAMN04488038_107167 [Solimonas aquatica]|uniref:DUF456 domain-containing protein n=1 Tax=Solimonas aquatica TaxID=489703 RepID=A0A1H9GQU0_9GAMM|nr:DUF456 family protein [Solimonas aquatica]SEQ52414.1 hypothetical protein SAMN04488038_107167 [Solimonas aquatica]